VMPQAVVELLRREAGAAGRDPARLRVPLRVIESAGRADVVAALPALAAAGVDEVIVDSPGTATATRSPSTTACAPRPCRPGAGRTGLRQSDDGPGMLGARRARDLV